MVLLAVSVEQLVLISLGFVTTTPPTVVSHFLLRGGGGGVVIVDAGLVVVVGNLICFQAVEAISWLRVLVTPLCSTT